VLLLLKTAAEAMAAHVAHDDTSSIGSNVSDGGSVEGAMLQKTFAGSNDEHEVTVPSIGAQTRTSHSTIDNFRYSL
jgi:hypothetical protein